jgi:hypothetical protein
LPSVCKNSFKIFCRDCFSSYIVWFIIGFIIYYSIYHWRFIFPSILNDSFAGEYARTKIIFSLFKIPHSMPFSLLMFLLRNLLFSEGFTFTCLFFILDNLQCSFFVACVVVLMIICSLGQVCLVSWRHSVPQWESPFLRFGKFFAIILLNNTIGLDLFSFFNGMIHRFVLFMELLNSYVFLSQLFSLLSKKSAFFFNMYSGFKSWDSVFYLF